MVFAVLGLLALGAAVCSRCGGGGVTSVAPGGTPQEGGILKVETASDVLAVMDPQKEYYQDSFQLFRCCLLRNLMSSNGLDAEHGGTTAVPDLAASEPTVSSDGLTWTFKIKSGIHYSPPLQDVEVTAGDFIRALQREASPNVGAAYPFYYTVIQGFADVQAGKAKTISGLSAPD